MIQVYANNINYGHKNMTLYKITINYWLSPFSIPFIYSYKIIYLRYNDVYFEYSQRYKKMTVKQLKEFIFENYNRGIGFTKENRYCMEH